MIAATGWRLEELDLGYNTRLGAAGLAALAAAPTFAPWRLNLVDCNLDVAALLTIAHVPWPLEDLDLAYNDFSEDVAGPALAALSRHVGLRRLRLECSELAPADFREFVEAGFPALEELDLSRNNVGAAGAALLASRPWLRLRELDLCDGQLGDAGVAALARGEFPALERLNLRSNRCRTPLTLEEARRWAPALVELHL